MRYLLMIYNNDETVADFDGPGAERFDAVHRSLIEELSANGELVDTNPLSHTGKVVRRREGTPEVTDGPYAETKEFVGGYYLVDVVDEERAVEVAARFREADTSLVEVRRIESASTDEGAR